MSRVEWRVWASVGSAGHCGGARVWYGVESVGKRVECKPV